jgi:hypothetical protein
MKRNAMEYRDCNGERPEPQHDLPRDQIRHLPLKRAEDHAVIQDATAAALLRLLPLGRIVEVLRALPMREQTSILAQAVREGTLTRVGADQILFAISFDGNR